MNTILDLDFPPNKIVSLVPSITESLFDLGFGEHVVGITDYCVHPQEKVKGLPRVGGPKTINVELIKDLNPDLVICNQEENDAAAIQQLISDKINVWVTYPLTVRNALDDLWTLAELYHSEFAINVMKNLDDSLEWMRLSAPEKEFRYFCPIWRRVNNENQIEWMTFNQNTYMNDLLSVWGGKNIFADGENPEALTETGKRYFYVNLNQIVAARPDMIILPDEPYPFSEAERNEIMDGISKFLPSEKVKAVLLDGSLITWPGTRLAKSLQTLPQLFSI
jgi:iron complex transport system substrate-binding protein